jgi:DNA primase
MSGRIPQSFIDDLLARVDVVDVVNSRVPLKKAGRDFTACCPFHSEKTPSFSVSPNKQFYHCFGCGAHGTAVGFLMEYEHLGFVEAIDELARSVGLSVPQEASRESARGTDDLYAVMALAAEFFRAQLDQHPKGTAAWNYLKGRGLNKEIVDTYGIGLAPPGWNNLERAMTGKGIAPKTLIGAGLLTDRDDGSRYDRFRHRIVFPIRDRRGRTVAFGGRVFEEGEPKYLNSPETAIFQKGRELYGFFEARSRERKLERMLVVEGYMDVVALAQSGINHAVATLGTATTGEHVKTLFRTVPSVTFCFDGDRAGREAAWRALQNTLPAIRDGREARFLFLPDGEDPDSMVRREGAEAFSARTSDATLLSAFLTENLTAGLDATKPDGRAGILERARPLLGAVPGGAFWELMVNTLSDLTHLAPERVKHLLIGKDGSPAKQRERASPTRTPVRHAVALLLYRPGLAATIEEPETLRRVREPGVPLLVELLEMGRASPNLTTAGVLERYRGTEHEAALTRLSRWAPEIPDEKLARELADTVERLLQRHGSARLLLDKMARGESLSEDERETLRRDSGRVGGKQNLD